MGAFGEQIKAADPDTYGAQDAQAIEESVSKSLADPTLRPHALAEIRRVFPNVSHHDDATILSQALMQLPPPPSDPAQDQRYRTLKTMKPVAHQNARSANMMQDD